jgi:hypothetical protein
VGRHATLVKPELSEGEVFAMWEILRYRYKGRRLAWRVFVDGLDHLKICQRQYCQTNGIIWMDIESVVPKTLHCFIDHVHYSEAGEEAVGKAFARGLLAEPRLAGILVRDSSGTPSSSDADTPKP